MTFNLGLCRSDNWNSSSYKALEESYLSGIGSDLLTLSRGDDGNAYVGQLFDAKELNTMRFRWQIAVKREENKVIEDQLPLQV